MHRHDPLGQMARYASAVTIALSLTSLLGLGCGITKKTHKQVKDDLASCQSERDSLAAKRSELANELEAQTEKHEGDLKAKEEELAASKDELVELRQQRKEMNKQIEEFQKLSERFKEMIAADGIQIYVRRGRMIVSLPSGVLFPSGKAELSPRGLKTLTMVAQKLDDFKDRRFLVAGHTDNVRIKKAKDFQDNWELSSARAIRVVRHLIEKGMNPKNLAAVGYGQYDPVKSNKSLSGRRLNRRIELILEPRVPDFTKLAKLGQPSDND